MKQNGKTSTKRRKAEKLKERKSVIAGAISAGLFSAVGGCECDEAVTALLIS